MASDGCHKCFLLIRKFKIKLLAREGEDGVGLALADEGERAGDERACGKGFKGGGVGIEAARLGIGVDCANDRGIEGGIALLLGGEGEHGTQIAVSYAEAQRGHTHLDSKLCRVAGKYALDLA